jgi:hypothetical protein
MDRLGLVSVQDKILRTDNVRPGGVAVAGLGYDQLHVHVIPGGVSERQL